MSLINSNLFPVRSRNH